MKLKLLAASFIVLCTALPVRAASLVLAWNASKDPKVVGYKIHYGTESGKYTKTVRVKGRLTTKATVENLDEGQSYFFSVTSYDANGNESAFSGEITNSPAAATGQAPTLPLRPPSRKVDKSPEGKILPTH